MEISVLQSLIDRTSNQIAETESYLEYWSSEQNRHQGSVYVNLFKRDLKKLVKIQKALKKEIAHKIALERGVRFVAKMRELLGEEE